MNKKIILLPFLVAGLLIGCNQGKTPVSPSGSEGSGGESGGGSSQHEPELWELDLVEGESSFQQVKDAIDALEAVGDQKTSEEYFKVRGTVVFNSGATLGIHRGGQYLYCYNFNGDSSVTGNEDMEAHPIGAYVEVVAKGSRYKTSPHQLFAYASNAYDPDAKLKVLSERGEPFTPAEIDSGEDLTAAMEAGGGMVKFMGAVAQGDYTINGKPAANLDMSFKLADDTAFPVRLEKYASAEEAEAFNGTIEEKSVFTIVSYLSAQSNGDPRAYIGGGCSMTKTADGDWAEPTGVTITAAGDATELEVEGSLQLTAVVAPEGAKQVVTWTSSDEDVATVDEFGVVRGVAAGPVVITATAKEGVAGTISLTVKNAAVNYVSVASLSFNKNANVAITNELSDTSDPKITYAENGISIVVRKNTSSSDVNVWKSDYASARWYVGHQIIISANKEFKRVVLTCDSGYAIFKDGATGIIADVSGGASVSYDGLKIILDLPAAANSLTIVPDKQIRPNNVELFKVDDGQAEAVLPVGNFSGHITSAGDENMFSTIALGNEAAYVEVGSQVKFTTTYTYAASTKTVTITHATYGDFTAVYDETANALTQITAPAAIAALIKNNGQITLNGATKFYDFEGTAAEVNTVFGRRVRSSSGWEATLQDVTLSTDQVIGGKGAVVLEGSTSYNAVGLTLRADLAQATGSNIGFWVYNPSSNDVRMQSYYYKGTGYSSFQDFYPTATAGQWTYYRIGTQAFYNITIADFTKSGVNFVIDNLAIF